MIQLFDTSSVVEYYESFALHAFESTSESVMTQCVILGPSGRAVPCAFCFSVRRDLFSVSNPPDEPVLQPILTLVDHVAALPCYGIVLAHSSLVLNKLICLQALRAASGAWSKLARPTLDIVFFLLVAVY